MAREGVSYEQVAAAADALVAEGRQPSIRAVRERLRGTGSPNTIHRHLTQWREARPRAVAAVPELPASIIREIHQEIERAAAEARAGIEDRLVQAQAEATDLAAAGEALEAERDALLEQIAGLTRERDTLAGKAAEQGAEIGRLGQEIDRERHAAEEARIEVAQARLKIEGQGTAIDEQRTEIERLRAELAQERKARTEAQREQAALEASRSALTERLGETQLREQRAGEQVADLRARLDELAQTDRAGAEEVARLGGALKAAQEALARVEEAGARAHKEMEALRLEAQDKAVECAGLAGQLAALRGDTGQASGPGSKRPRKGGPT